MMKILFITYYRWIILLWNRYIWKFKE